VLIEEKNLSQRAYFLVDKQGLLRWSHMESELGHRREDGELLAEIAKL
jgi:alkyl hydroperoxide reductase subunit AhpC